MRRAAEKELDNSNKCLVKVGAAVEALLNYHLIIKHHKLLRHHLLLRLLADSLPLILLDKQASARRNLDLELKVLSRKK
jgi:hypothetical protein